MQSLQKANSFLEVIVESLRTLSEVDSMRLLHSLRLNGSNEAVAASIQADTQPRPGFGLTLKSGNVRHQFHHNLASAQSDAQSNMTLLSSQSWPSSGNRPPPVDFPYDGASPWFQTPADPEFIEHLLELYFTWIHPFHQLFSRDLFSTDFRQGQGGHCSALLANVIAAFACHYSDRLAARADPDDPKSAGDHFFTEAKRLLELQEQPSLTMVQALAIMSFREESCGRGSNGYQYMGRSSCALLEMGLHLSEIGSSACLADYQTRQITFWGVFNAET